jgi:UDP-glucuronate 4-epimerase
MGLQKKTNELMAYTYHHLYGIPVTGLRFFTVYGPWGRPDMAYFSFTKAILENKPIDVYHYGKMQRDFTYIDDIVEGVIAAIDLAAPCEIFNLGNHRPEPLSALISNIEDSLGKKAKMRHLPMQPGDVEATYADIEYSHQKLGFIPKVTLQEGISRFIKWYIGWQR